jgi:hypothetical protein
MVNISKIYKRQLVAILNMSKDLEFLIVSLEADGTEILAKLRKTNRVKYAEF